MVRTDKHEEIIKAIKEHHEATNGKCGLSFVALLRKVKLSIEEARPFLKELHENKEFHVRNGINDKLFMYGSKKRR